MQLQIEAKLSVLYATVAVTWRKQRRRAISPLPNYLCFCYFSAQFISSQARREGEVGGKLPRASRRLWGSAVAQKYKNTPECTILKKNHNCSP